MSISAAIKAMMQADLASTVRDWSEVLTFKGSTITGTYSPIDTGDTISEEGILDTASGQFVCNADTFAAMTDKPDDRDTVDIAGTKYHVVDILRDPACVTINVRRN
jgi:hypothetical protein